MIKLALNLKVLKYTDLFIDPSKINKIDSKQVIIMTTGTQGEERAGLLLMANGTHKLITLNKSDTIVLSSSFIPGNENAINSLLNLLYKKELTVITNKDRGVHTSGHASVEELKSLIQWIRPNYFIPIHGEPIQLVSHKKIALEENIPENNIFLMENGKILEFSSNKSTVTAKITDKINMNPIYKEGKRIQKISNKIFSERHALWQSGVISIYLLVKNSKLKEMDIQNKGFTDKDNSELVERLEEIIKDFIKKNMHIFNKNKKEFEVLVKKKIITYLYRELDKCPLIFLKTHNV